MRVSTADQGLDLQLDALEAGRVRAHAFRHRERRELAAPGSYGTARHQLHAGDDVNDACQHEGKPVGVTVQTR